MKVFYRILVLGAFALGLLEASPALAQGYQVQPMLATITPSAGGSRMTMSVKNTGTVPITLELTPFRATVDEAGVPRRVDDLKDLLVYPPQTMVPPGKEQTVQIRYIGDPALIDARMYGVRVAQLPIDFTTAAVGQAGASTTVKVSFNFLSHIIVSPEKAVPLLSVTTDGLNPNGDLRLTLMNNGPGIAMLSDTALELSDQSGKTVTIKPQEFKAGDFSALMPKQARRMTLAAKDLSGLSGTIKSRLAAAK
jgi:fimbrial chaperone protein